MMNKQRMLSAMMLGIALNITTPNCTTQTMLSVSAKPNPTKTMYTTTGVNVRVKPSAKSKKVKTLKMNTKVVVVKKHKNGWSKIKLKGKYRYICSKYLSKKKVKYVDMDTPSNNSFKSYMSYKCITNRSSKQYKFQQECYTGYYGIRMKDGRYCIAVGSYYTTKIGKKIDLVMENGAIIKCILADCKANAHTDSTNRQNPNGSIAEFIVDMNSLNRTAKRMGDVSYCSEKFKGEIKKIRVYK